MSKILKSVIILASIILVAVLGSIFVNLGMDWFNSLNKPSQWIPNILIPIVWTIIYLTFATILLIWNNKKEIPTSTNILLIINGILNILWCLIFFTLKMTFLGNIIIILNLIASILLWQEIYTHSKAYAYILLIYPIWLSIATTLNTALWILN